MSNTAQNFRLGLFVFAGIFIFILAIYFLGNRQNMFGDNVRISSVFKNVNGLQMGNNVRFAGVNVGTVRGITILNDTAINVDMFINEKTAQLIKKNALATISSDGLVGSMIVNIIPNDNFIEQRIENGDTIKSISKIATADMLTTLNTTNENAALLTQDLLRITSAINSGEGLLGALIKDESLLDDVKKSVSNLEQTTQVAKTSMFEINKIIKEVNFDDNVVGLLLKDTLSARKLALVFENIEASSKEIEALTKNLNAFSETLKSNDGLLNYVIHDTTIVKNIDATLKNAKEASEKLNENMEALKENFLFRSYFRKLERQKAREERKKNK